MLLPGSRVGEYEVARLAAAGAMCDVYEARQAPGGRRVALKVLNESWCLQGDVVGRFLNEARLLQGIRHPHVVALLACGSLPNGPPYMVLEWLPISLADALSGAAGRAATPAEAVRVALQMADALGALHERGIIHRDLKPENVLLDVNDLAVAHSRLADFGLAKVRGAQATDIAAVHVSTGGSVALGTWDYMAPEQWIKSKDAGPKADVYALGVLLFQMLAGRLPFRAEQPKDLMCLHLFEDPPLHLLGERTPAVVRDLVARMLSKTAPARPSMQEVLAGLSEAP